MKRLHDAFPPVPDQVHRQVEDMLLHLPPIRRRRRVVRAGLGAVAGILLLLVLIILLRTFN